jgi:glutathione synthase/RimK-type ligase-like ATP-grasp enzyme
VRDKASLMVVIEQNPYLTEDSIIVQEYIMDHSETLIKVYAIGKLFDPITKPTFPISAVQHFLDVQGFLKIEQKNKFDGFKFKPKREIVFPMDDFKKMIDFFADKMKIYLHGVDIVRNDKDGKFYLFDCNYASSYNDSFDDQNLANVVINNII